MTINAHGLVSVFINEMKGNCFAEFPEDKRGKDVRQSEAVSLMDVSDRKFCSACQCSFESREEQVW